MLDLPYSKLLTKEEELPMPPLALEPISASSKSKEIVEQEAKQELVISGRLGVSPITH